MRREGILLAYLLLLLPLLDPVRVTLGKPLIALAAASMAGGYILTITLPERIYRWFDGRREVLFFWGATLFLIALLILLLYNFSRSPRGIREILLYGRGVWELSVALLTVLTLVAGASLGKAARTASKYPLATGVLFFLPVVMVCYILHPPSGENQFNFFKEAALAILFMAIIEEVWSDGKNHQHTYTLQNSALAAAGVTLAYLIWQEVISEAFYSSSHFPGLYLSLLLSLLLLSAGITLFWFFKKHV